MTRRQTVADALLAGGLAVISVLVLRDFEGIDAAAYALALAHVLPLAVRRRWPLEVFTVAVVVAVVHALLGYPVVALGPAPLLAAYTAGAELRRPRSLVALAVIQAAMVVAIVVPGRVDSSTAVGDSIALAVFWLLGDAAHRRKQVAALLRDRAVADERARIARELHDIVAHSLSVIVVQAGTGRLVVDQQPDQAKVALQAIEATGRGALDEMRRLLDVLRSPADAGARLPTPTLADLDGLVADSRAGGLHVDVRVEGDARPLQAGIELAGYRIVQEALTNVRRHAVQARRAEVVLGYEDGGLRIEVADDGLATAAPAPAPEGNGVSSGLGIVGMRERAAMYDGAVVAGPCPSGGFKVTATLREQT